MKKFSEYLSNVVRIFALCLGFVLFLSSQYSIAGELKPKVGATIVESSGNVDSMGIKLDGELLYEQESSAQSLKGGLRYAETDEVKSANSSYIEFKNNNNLTDDVLYLYQSAKLEGDEFIGYNYRMEFNGGLGLKYKAFVDSIKIETGPGFVYEDTDDEDKGFPSYRNFLKYTYHFSDRISGSSYIEHIRDLEVINNYRTKWVAQADIQLTEGFGLRASREFSYINMPPKGSSMHDWITSFTLVMTF
jgi:putative salt-induced outer membrane protein YdiY